ncbi:MAG: phosphate ABC transporter permease PstA [Cyanobacteria bacterium P01_A01_bin.17]
MAAVVWSTAVFVTLILLWLVGDLVWQGSGQVNWAFLMTPPEKAGVEGGIFPILVSTGLILMVCMAVATPLGVGTAILLTEFSGQVGPLGRAVRLSLDILAGVPSIVFGLFGNALFSKRLGLGFSILSGGLTLACMVLPILIRSVQEGLLAVPQDYRRSAAALGLSRTATLGTLIVPAAMPGIVVGLLLGIGRAIAETAALIFTSGYVDRMPSSLLDSGRSLSIHIYDLATNIAGGEPHAYATALVLMGTLILINAGVSWLAYRFRQSRLQVN